MKIALIVLAFLSLPACPVLSWWHSNKSNKKKSAESVEVPQDDLVLDARCRRAFGINAEDCIESPETYETGFRTVTHLGDES